MKATIRDVYNALTLRNCIAFGGIVVASYFLIDILSYFIWRRFPVPVLVLTVAVLGWRIGRRIGHAGLSKVLNAASVGLGCFGGIIFIAAILDGWLFPEAGYISWISHISMWGWIAFHIRRAWCILRDMPAGRLIHVTEGTEAIYAEMTYREARVTEVIKKYNDAAKCVTH